jgi:hypothetical protein
MTCDMLTRCALQEWIWGVALGVLGAIGLLTGVCRPPRGQDCGYNWICRKNPCNLLYWQEKKNKKSKSDNSIDKAIGGNDNTDTKEVSTTGPRTVV